MNRIAERLKITCDQASLEKSLMCGYGEQDDISTNCWIAIAVRDIFPHAKVCYEGIFPFYHDDTTISKADKLVIDVPTKAASMMRRFDKCRGIKAKTTASRRRKLKPFSFIIDVPEEVIEQIDISAVYEGHPTLEFVEA
ncbi:MAG: hypothetical protein ACFB15_25890 [Cyclobacteriaceae bacterium]